MTESQQTNQGAISFVSEEKRAQGGIGAGVYLRYLKAMRGIAVFALPMLAVMVVANVFSSLFKWLVGVWVEGCEGSSCLARPQWEQQVRGWFGQLSDESFLTFLGVLVLAGIFIRLMSWFLFQFFLARGGRSLHNDMASSLGRVRISFFDENPSGRLVRRFSGDYSQMQSEIPRHLGDIINSIIELLWVVAIIILQAPLAAVACVPCGYMYIRVQDLYRPASREIQRLSKVLETPVWSLFTETMSGYQTIRAYGRTDEFLVRLRHLLKEYSYSVLTMSRMTRWLNIRLKLASETLALVVVLLIAWSCASGNMGVGTAGFLMSLTIGLDMAMQWLTRSISLIEASMVSVERILEYRDLPDEEKPGRRSETPSGWPQQGEIEFDNYTMGYRADLPVVLSGLNLKIPGGSRVGIIGRTGAGKSSLLQALFRMVDHRGGEIRVDGVDIHSLPLNVARTLFGIIPQEPLLFSGTLRYNLDRTGRFGDEDIWKALEKVELHSFVEALPGGLDYVLTERGGNISVGQRQLFCMARALLVDAPIILMDEATASVDSETDVLIHHSLLRSFAGRTMLIIAHRLQTVRDCDLVVVIGEGRVVDFGPAREVLAKFLSKDVAGIGDVDQLLK